MRLSNTIALAGLAAVLLAGCGGSGDQPKAALGSPDNPVVARPQGSSPTSGTATARKAARALAQSNAAAAEGGATAVAGATPSATKRKRQAAAAAAAAGEPTGPATSSSGRAKANAAPSYAGILKQRGASTGQSFSPCNLVSQRRAEAIIGRTIQTPLEAPQGPTCIYRTKDNTRFVTVLVQQSRYAAVRRQLRRATQLSVEGHTAYCGTLGQPVLYVPLSGTRLLTISAPCTVAKAFAATAVQKLTA